LAGALASPGHRIHVKQTLRDRADPR
jgi:hypothetical protein